MRLNDGTMVGLCYSFSFSAANLYVVLSTKDAARNIKFDRVAIFRLIGWSLVFSIPVAAAIWTLGWLLTGFDDRPDHGLRVGVAGLLAIAGFLTTVWYLAAVSARQLKQATGIDALRRAGMRPVLIGAALGMVLSGIYIFGGHLVRMG